MSHPRANVFDRLSFVCSIARYRLQGYDILYLDESGFAVDSPRTHGYSEKGKRCYATKDWHARGRINAIGAIIGFTFLTVSLFDCNINSDVFYAWLTQDLLPKLSTSVVIVMDNASFHKRADMVQAIREAGHIPLYLPPYSPDLTPIEPKWAQVKAVRRKKRCNIYDLFSNQEYAVL